MAHALHLTGDSGADELLSGKPLALILGMTLDQQVAMEVAFAGPKKLADRLGGLDAAQIAGMDPEAFAAVCAEKPAVHRFPGSMAKRIQALCQAVADEYDGQAEEIWTRANPDGTAPDGAEVRRRLEALPGWGKQKAQIFLALLGKQLGLEAPGWREAAGDYGAEGTQRSIADVTDADTLAEVREAKRQAKAAAKKQ